MLSMTEIEAFRAAIMTGSLSAAARLLGTSQPNVTRLISRMERRLGYALFIRRSRGVTPTVEAEMLHAEVDQSFYGLSEISRAAEEIGQFKGAHITVGSVPAPLLGIVPQALAAWSERFGDLSITVELRESERILHWIRARRFDIGLVSPIHQVRDVNIITRHRLPYLALGPGDHPLFAGQEGALDLGTIGDVPLIVPGLAYFMAICPDPGTRAAIQQKLRIDAFVSQTAAQFAMDGLGIALVDPITAHHFTHRFGARTRPLAGAPTLYDLALVAPHHPVHARATVQFSALLSRAIDAAVAAVPAPQ
ncbi:MAG: LysR family transcriptional regulator [Rubellimicrobium sp.]|nr:LysR family transcriptional regulator [Rubellimicrobium sp.]